MKEKYYKSNLFKKDYTFFKNNIFESFITSDEQEEDDSVVEQEVDDSIIDDGVIGDEAGEGEEQTDSGEQEESDEGGDSEGEGEGDSEGEDGEEEQTDSGEQEESDEEGDVSIKNPETINRVILSKNINEENKQIYDYTIKEFYYNFINSTLEITKSIKETMSNSSDMKTKSSLMDVLSNKKNLINVGIMLILISIFLSPLLL